MDKKGALGLIIGIIVVAVLVVGGIVYFAFSGKSDNNNQVYNASGGSGSGGAQTGTGGGGSSGSSGGTGSSGSGGSGEISSSWCSANGGKIEKFKGQDACHTIREVGYGSYVNLDETYTIIIDKDYWKVQDLAGAYKYESHFVNGKVIELNCLSENPQSLAMCEQFKTTYCPTCP